MGRGQFWNPLVSQISGSDYRRTKGMGRPLSDRGPYLQSDPGLLEERDPSIRSNMGLSTGSLV